jgi:hypothetical protein
VIGKRTNKEEGDYTIKRGFNIEGPTVEMVKEVLTGRRTGAGLDHGGYIGV